VSAFKYKNLLYFSKENFSKLEIRFVLLLLFWYYSKETMKKESRSVAVFAKGVAACSHQAKTYGQCITARYTDVHRDVCAKEFQAFKNCVQQSLKKAW
jgi:NADH dehydrogenase [ubiquinone] 1 alpha subcomplex assembly factor 8